MHLRVVELGPKVPWSALCVVVSVVANKIKVPARHSKGDKNQSSCNITYYIGSRHMERIGATRGTSLGRAPSLWLDLRTSEFARASARREQVRNGRSRWQRGMTPRHSQPPRKSKRCARGSVTCRQGSRVWPAGGVGGFAKVAGRDPCVGRHDRTLARGPNVRCGFQGVYDDSDFFEALSVTFSRLSAKERANTISHARFRPGQSSARRRSAEEVRACLKDGRECFVVDTSELPSKEPERSMSSLELPVRGFGCCQAMEEPEMRTSYSTNVEERLSVIYPGSGDDLYYIGPSISGDFHFRAFNMNSETWTLYSLIPGTSENGIAGPGVMAVKPWIKRIDEDERGLPILNLAKSLLEATSFYDTKRRHRRVVSIQS
jgi:hypothetical protein